MVGLLKNMFHGNEREIKRYYKKVALINALEEKMTSLSDDQFKEKTAEFKERLTKGETLDDLLVEAFALVREASKRVLNMRHYDVQLIGGMALHNGNIAEMRTGEGKTLVATLPAYLNALSGKGVHIITVNEYLAQRDSEEMGVLYNFLGLSVAVNLNQMTPEEKRNVYQADITYGTNSEFGFDYLRDNMVVYQEELVQRPLSFAIVDEVDSILIDEARTPLIISGQAEKSVDLYVKAARFVQKLTLENDYTVDQKGRTAMLTEQGVAKAEKEFSIDNLYDTKYFALNHHIQQGLKAKAIMKRDVDYVVQNGEVKIVDEFTGRIMEGRRYSDGLHQSIEAKEGLDIQNESMTLATITLQNYFRMYEKLAGMTGTAKTEEPEFRKIYKLNVLVIPTNKKVQRQDLPDRVYRNEKAKYQAIIEIIKEKHEKGQPVLVGTTSIENSEKISDMLKKKGVKHTVLNAKFHEKEAEIVSMAGQKGAVTIATNMAGRGTDIKLEEGVTDLGGLHIIGTERHESRRIDNQLRGRAGRQGDAGSTQFVISLEDELMKKFGAENMKKMMERLGVEENEPIESKLITRAIESAQKRVEGSNFDTRKNVLEYDDVMNQQRNIIYKQRREVIESGDIKALVFEMVERVIERTVSTYCADDIEEEWDLTMLTRHISNVFLPEGIIKEEDLKGKDATEITEAVKENVYKLYAEKEEKVGDILREFEKIVILRAVDSKWMEHIDIMDQMRQGIHLRAYGQTNPLQEYQMEAFQMFNQMIASIEEEVTLHILKSEIEKEEPMHREEVVDLTKIQTSNGDSTETKKPVRSEKVGRNTPCPCGSGKKYKQCHGK
jgi:preprotein translocase subunit SecA